jgi:hypothetical protein
MEDQVIPLQQLLHKDLMAVEDIHQVHTVVVAVVELQLLVKA